MKSTFYWLLAALILIAAYNSEAGDKPFKVAIIDTGLDLNDPRFTDLLCKEGHKDFTGTGLKDTDSHGTHIAGLIKEYAGGYDKHYCLLILKFWLSSQNGQQNTAKEVLAIEAAVKSGADLINISAGGPQFEESEYLAIRNAPHTLFVVGAGNDNEDISKKGSYYYPASYHLKNVVAVGGLQKIGGTDETTKLFCSNYGKYVNAWEMGYNIKSTFPMGYGVMTGTSQATAIHTGKLIKTYLSLTK